MNRPMLRRRALLGFTAAIAVALLIGAALAAALERGYFRGPLIRFVSSRVGRALVIEGPIELHLLTLHPRISAQRITIGNPPWMRPGTAAQLGRLSLTIGLPWIHRSLGLERLEIAAGQLTLVRNDTGLANWQWTDPRGPEPSPLPVLRSLSAEGVHATLQDDIRHLQFDGWVSAREPPVPNSGNPLKIEGAGKLNGRPVQFNIDSDPLGKAQHDKPYEFTFSEQSSGSHLAGRGTLPQPFDFRLIDAAFEAAGKDLQDLYYLVGIKLLNTGPYRLTGRVQRRGTATRFADINVTSGQSDAHGSVAIDSSGSRPKLVIDFESQHIRLAELGLRAAGREPSTSGAPPLVLSAAALDPQAWRHDDAVATIHAHRLDVGTIPIQNVAATLTLNRGVLALAPLTGQVLDGHLDGHARMDLTADTPPDSVDITMSNVNLERYPSQDPHEPEVKGLLRARLSVQGRGRSLHELASTADGIVSAVVTHGIVRTSWAELSGLDLGAIKLLFDHPAPQTATKCAVAAFQAHGGVLTAQTLLVDTDPMLVTGQGTIQLDSEAINLTLQGHPKHPQLRLRSPVLVRGTLSHPTLAIQPGNAAAQTAAAVALGVLLTPLASILAFVDPGLAKDADCAALTPTGAHEPTESTPAR